MYCLARTEEVLPIALARPYIEQYVPTQTKVHAEDNWQCLAYLKMIDCSCYVYRKPWQHLLITSLGLFVLMFKVKTGWVISLGSSLEKLAALSTNIGYPDDIFNDDYVNDLYKTVRTPLTAWESMTYLWYNTVGHSYSMKQIQVTSLATMWGLRTSPLEICFAHLCLEPTIVNGSGQLGLLGFYQPQLNQLCKFKLVNEIQ